MTWARVQRLAVAEGLPRLPASYLLQVLSCRPLPQWQAQVQAQPFVRRVVVLVHR